MVALTRLWKKCGDIDKTIEEVAHNLEFGDSENGESIKAILFQRERTAQNT